jgi:acetyl-CoA acetyltransferase
MNVFVVGLAVHPARDAITDHRLEEMAFYTSRAALADAGVERGQLDHVTLAASDEVDARSISSMLLAAPAGAYLKDELRVTDSGLIGLAMSALRVASGRFNLGLVASWSQTSVLPLAAVVPMRAEPFYLRPVGMNDDVADGLFAGAVQARYGIDEKAVAARVVERARAAGRNPRAVPRRAPTSDEISSSAPLAWPLRTLHRAPITDGGAALVLASEAWLAQHPGTKPLARIAGMAWGVDSYRLDRARLTDMEVLRSCYAQARARARWNGNAHPDVVELDAPTGWHDLAFCHALDFGDGVAVSPSGGAWAQNPYFCTGLVAACESVNQVAGRAGPHQVAGARRAVAHGNHGFAQQGHAVLAFEGMKR